MNKGWPTLLWDLYNNDGDQAGALLRREEGQRALHALYTQDNGTVTLDNLGGSTKSGLSVESKVYNTAGKVLDDRTANGISLRPQQVRNSVLTPKVPAVTKPPAAATHLFRRTAGQAARQGRGPQRVLAVHPAGRGGLDQTMGNPQATMTQYANLQGLQSLGTAKVSVVAATTDASPARTGPTG